MEFIEGETLAERLSKGALPLEDVLEYGLQIADGLDTAHRAGIVHRDLKPGNAMLTKSGIKLLDFGLAKLLAEGTVSPSSDAETRQRDLTKEQTILGTLQYMAPEQLEGSSADGRSDIWAFGAMLYEMLTGKKAFDGDSQASLIGAILKDDPAPLAELQPMSPPLIEQVVEKCLEKKPDQRWQRMSDVAIPLRWAAEHRFENSAAVAPVKRASRLALAGAGLACALLGAMALSYFRPAIAPVSLDSKRFVLPFPEGQMLETIRYSSVTISPDGNHIAYVARDSSESRLYLRDLETFEAVSVPESEGALSPFFSHDGQWLGFFAHGRLQKVSIAGGRPSTVAEIGMNPRAGGGASWGPDDTIVFGGDDGL